jgi:O-antigen/teichoic acid export membrane protein
MAGGAVVSQVVQSVVLTAGPLRWFVGMQVLTALAVLATVVAVAAAGALTIGFMVAISCATTVLATALGVRALAACGALGSERLVTGVRAAGPVLRPYLPFALATFATLSLTRLVQRFDVLLVNGFRGEHAAGLYATAAQFGDLMLVVPAAVGFVLFRRGARGVEGHWEDAQRAIRWTAVVCTAGALAILVLAGRIVDLTFGTAYHGSVPALMWLLPGLVLLGVQSVISSYVASRGRPRAVLLAWTAGAVLGIALDLVAIPRWGISGAAAVSSLSYAVVVALHVRALRQVREADA